MASAALQELLAFETGLSVCARCGAAGANRCYLSTGCGLHTLCAHCCQTAPAPAGQLVQVSSSAVCIDLVHV